MLGADADRERAAREEAAPLGGVDRRGRGRPNSIALLALGAGIRSGVESSSCV